MAVRRTREEKIKAQQRRGETFSWSVEAKAEKKIARTSSSSESGTGSSKSLISPESRYLKIDLLRTLMATLFVIALLVFAYWRS